MMSNAYFTIPTPINEPVLNYAPGSPERAAVAAQYKKYFEGHADIPMYIGGAEVRTNNTRNITPPHDHQHVVGHYHLADEAIVDQAISNALASRKAWADTPWEHRAAVFLKAADLLAGPYRAKINAATMIAQSKTVHQAEIDASCELIDFLNFSIEFAYKMENTFTPISPEGMHNALEFRPLEGFVFAIAPFNFFSIGGNLAIAPAIVGNTVLWKPAPSAVYSSHIIMELYKEGYIKEFNYRIKVYRNYRNDRSYGLPL